jgi:hypothetical protein
LIHKTSTYHHYQKWFTFVFLGLLVLPNIILVYNLSFGKINPPKTHSPSSYGKFYLEHFGLKKIFSNAYLDFKTNSLEENPIPHRVFKGKNDWYFLGDHHNKIFSNAFGNDPLSISELDQIATNIELLRANLKAKNIDFYIIVPPDKNQIYKDKLPYQLQQNATKIEQLKPYLKEHIDFEIIDFKTELLNARKKTSVDLYYKYDTHWNNHGAYYAYSHFIDKLNKKHSISKVLLSDFKTLKTTKDYDLTRMLNIKIGDSALVLEKEHQSSTSLKAFKNAYRVFQNPNGTLNVVYHGDSFMYALMPFINETFKKVTYVKNDYVLKPNIIEEEQPDIIIFELVERNIKLLKDIK